MLAPSATAGALPHSSNGPHSPHPMPANARSFLPPPPHVGSTSPFTTQPNKTPQSAHSNRQKVPHHLPVNMNSYARHHFQGQPRQPPTKSTIHTGPTGTPKLPKLKRTKPPKPNNILDDDLDDDPELAFDESRWLVKGVPDTKSATNQNTLRHDTQKLSASRTVNLANNYNNHSNILAAPTDEPSDTDHVVHYHQPTNRAATAASTTHESCIPSDFDLPTAHDEHLAALSAMFPQRPLDELQFALEAARGDLSNVMLTTDHNADESTDPDPSHAQKRSKKSRHVPRKKRRILVSSPHHSGSEEILGLVQTPIQNFLPSDDLTDLDSDKDAAQEHHLAPSLLQLARQQKALTFFTTASPYDIMEYTNCTEDQAHTVIRKRPYPSHDALETALATDKKTRKLLEKYYQTLESFESIDQFVDDCDRTGREFAQALDSLTCLTDNASRARAKTDDDQDTGIALLGDMLLSLPSPSLLNPNMTLKGYQLVGVHWLYLLHQKGFGGILADEMGLGKTAQVIAWLALLKEKHELGLSLIVVPSSVMDNWLREFETWCPSLFVFPYSGSQKERSHRQGEFRSDKDAYDVILTTYNLVTSTKEDRSFFKKLTLDSLILDEGHMVKNMTSSRYSHLMKIKPRQRLLLTGTPLQNNLIELLSLMTFIMPNLIGEHIETLQYVLKSTSSGSATAERLRVAKRIMKPFVLRRKKDQVLAELPLKTCQITYCEPSPSQKVLYAEVEARSKKDLVVDVPFVLDLVDAHDNGKTKNQKAKKSTKKDANAGKKRTSNVLMELRKAAIHPLLFRRRFTDAMLKELATVLKRTPEYCDSNYDYLVEDLSVMTDYEIHKLCLGHEALRTRALTEESWFDAGKVQKLKELLPDMRARGDRVLIFSQFVIVLNILEDVLQSLDMTYTRLDGSTDVADRQDIIDSFNGSDDTFVFLLSTKAGGTGLNLTAANVVIFMDMDFNPHNDAQAECRAHRVGQTRQVTVYKLVTPNTIEEPMLTLCQRKLILDQNFQQDDAQGSDPSSSLDSDSGALVELLKTQWR
ncbi:hypothetical protein SeMB42_g01096 [Synchytrium endobioticum]|uniref:Uncharacterized protein n=1 Tax=Synchytrium endobioticum TaxID=286115 RepID=A0A507CGP7_9FUNG|nr:hypothetical protein SeLEV6574_g06675 [Synchytrium endobioticum]TPX52954.1 hypothetical protein SeMB42_g01096 [Synchytrium endobioticum]